jgi:dTDP-4-dehydrorhamnose 3,5-epimerase
MEITAEATPLQGVFVITPQAIEDERGFFLEVYRRDNLQKHGLPADFVQLNQSRSIRNVVRGLHFQWDPPMGKLMRVSLGEAFLVTVDLRKGSPTLGKWFGVTASAENKAQVWAPPGCARGFCVLSDAAEVEYLCTGIYNNKGESGILWSDSEIGIDWPVEHPILSEKDRNAQTFSQWLERAEACNFTYGS